MALNEQEKELFFDFYNTVNEKYTLDRYVFPKITTERLKSKKYYVEDTISFYKELHPDFNVKISQTVKDIFSKQIATKDTFAQLADQVVLKEIYSILLYIEQTQTQLDIVSSDNYPDKYFAKYDQDFRNIERLSQKYKKQVFHPEDGVPVSDTSEIRFKWKIFTLYNKDPKIFEYYLNSMVMGERANIIDYYDMEEKDVNLIFDLLSYLSTQKTTPNVIKKGLWIKIYFKLTKKLYFTATEAERITYELMLYLFDYELKSIDKKIFVKTIVNGLPVLGASRNTQYTPEQIDFFEKKFIEEYNPSEQVKEKIQETFKSNFDQAYAIPIIKYPLELLELNSKYSEEE